MKYAWENEFFFESKEQYIEALNGWLQRAENFISRYRKSNIYTQNIRHVYKCVAMAYQYMAKAEKKCAICGREFFFYNPLLNYYREQGEKYGVKLKPKNTNEMLNIREYSCPYCGAADRERAYALWMERELPKDKPIFILDIAPAPALGQFIKNKFPQAKYRTMDLFMPNVDYRLDIMNMTDIKDGEVDFFICSHVLEHVRDDRQAMRELRRILKPGTGRGIVVVPLDLEQEYIDKDPDCEDIGERWRRFGKDDHIRKYSKDGFLSRLKESGLNVAEYGYDYFGDKAKENSLSRTATVYIVSHDN